MLRFLFFVLFFLWQVWRRGLDPLDLSIYKLLRWLSQVRKRRQRCWAQPSAAAPPPLWKSTMPQKTRFMGGAEAGRNSAFVWKLLGTARSHRVKGTDTCAAGARAAAWRGCANTGDGQPWSCLVVEGRQGYGSSVMSWRVEISLQQFVSTHPSF